MKADVLRHVRANPNETCAQIAEALGVACAHVTIELQALRAEGKVRSRGRTRGTRWSAVAA